MTLQLVNFSIVVVAQHHNPTILNPDFLARREVVPEAWGWEVGPEIFSTPPLAQVQYKNGVTVLCEPSKLQLIDHRSDLEPSESQIGDIAAKYIQTLPHVRYTGLGINFQTVIPHERPKEELVQRFLKPGPWNTDGSPLQEVALRLFYPIPDARLRLSLEAGEVRSKDGDAESSPAIVVAANFHHDLDEDRSVEQIRKIVDKKGSYWGHLRTLASEIFDKQGGIST